MAPTAITFDMPGNLGPLLAEKVPLHRGKWAGKKCLPIPYSNRYLEQNMDLCEQNESILAYLTCQSS